MGRVLKPGATLLIRVPAIQALYGPHDKSLRTAHRYSAGELKGIIEASGMKVLRTTYANSLLLPIAVTRRLIQRFSGSEEAGSDVKPVAAPLNLALKTVLSSEAFILNRTRLPIGLSVIALARKS
jgi:hypothetical protein